jgi:hypothetical protein
MNYRGCGYSILFRIAKEKNQKLTMDNLTIDQGPGDFIFIIISCFYQAFQATVIEILSCLEEIIPACNSSGQALMYPVSC